MRGMGQRRRLSYRLWLWAFALAFLGTSSQAGQARADAARDAIFEEKVMADIRAENPEAAPLFAEAMAAAKRQDEGAARTGLERVIQLAPKSDHAYRRLCGLEVAARQTEQGIAHCRRALAMRDAPENHSAFARAILDLPQGSKLEIQSALDHAQRGLAGDPDNPHAIIVMIQVQMAAQDVKQAMHYAAQLEKVAPEDVETHVMLMMLNLSQGELETARTEFEKAKKLGLSEDGSKRLQEILDQQTAREQSGVGHYIKRIVLLFGLWGAGFALLLGLGWVLSQFVLRARNPHRRSRIFDHRNRFRGHRAGGGGWLKLRGRTERCLILGAAVLEGMPIRAFKAVLAHEYGHFKNEDTAGGGFALAMQRSLMTMALALAHGGAAKWYSPAWWFVRGFHLVFLRVSHGASRLQEILADRWAAMVYGSASFERGLRHVIDRAVRFDAHANAALKEVIEKRVAVANFYTYTPERAASEKDLVDQLEKALARPASPYDSHPPPNQRIAWVRAMGVAGEPSGVHEEGDAWALFCDRARIEELMTHRIRTSLASEGIVLPTPSREVVELGAREVISGDERRAP